MEKFEETRELIKFIKSFKFAWMQESCVIAWAIYVIDILPIEDIKKEIIKALKTEDI
jgi:hypothetical protein